MALTSGIWQHLDQRYNGVDPPNDFESRRERKKKRADELRQQASPPEHIMRDGLDVFEPEGIHFDHSVALHGYIADFYCTDLQIVLEVDGGYHRGRLKYDTRRDYHLRKLGIRTLRFTTTQVRQDMPAVIDTIRKYIRVVKELRSRDLR